MDGRFRDNINSRIGWAEWRILTGITDLSAESARRLTLIFSARKSRCPRVYRHLGTYSLEERIIAPRVSEIRPFRWRSEEHTSELQSHLNLVSRLLLEKKKTHTSHKQRRIRDLIVLRSSLAPPPRVFLLSILDHADLR